MSSETDDVIIKVICEGEIIVITGVATESLAGGGVPGATYLIVYVCQPRFVTFDRRKSRLGENAETQSFAGTVLPLFEGVFSSAGV